MQTLYGRAPQKVALRLKGHKWLENPVDATVFWLFNLEKVEGVVSEMEVDWIQEDHSEVEVEIAIEVNEAHLG